MRNQHALRRFRRVFSGPDSHDMWQDIKRVKRRREHAALYSLGCRCQQLESIITRLEERIAELEKDEP